MQVDLSIEYKHKTHSSPGPIGLDYKSSNINTATVPSKELQQESDMVGQFQGLYSSVEIGCVPILPKGKDEKLRLSLHPATMNKHQQKPGNNSLQLIAWTEDGAAASHLERPTDGKSLTVQIVKERDNENEMEKCVGIIMDRVKGAPIGDGSLRLTGYHQRTGRIISTRNSGMLWTTAPVKSNIKHGYFIFGEQEISFYDVIPEEDMILIIRFYHWPNGNVTTAPWDFNLSMENLMETEEWLVAWGVLRLSRSTNSYPLKAQSPVITWNTGTHTLPLFHRPVPSPHDLSVLPGEHLYDIWEPYGQATVRLHLFTGSRPRVLTTLDSPVDTDMIKEWPDVVYIYHVRPSPPSSPFNAGDGFDLYIDGARFLPDAVTISRVTGRIFDRNYKQFTLSTDSA
ncbi:uncharacterized protein [Scyliorhinus torazame]|uniref:uncharacterized protein n=1 Tax=Scyliorhinus torazame TaxID=75743 RepID=UPI003B58FC29